jgi:hypothetical protein
MKGFAAIPLLTSAALSLASSPSAGKAEYLRLRKQYGITRPTQVAALETTLGTKIAEVEALVKGVFSTEDHVTLILERADGEDLLVDSHFRIDWLSQGEATARLLVRAQRDGETAPLRVKLLAVARPEEIAPYDPKPQPSPPLPTKTKRPSPPPGSGGPLTGPIGRPGSASGGKKRDWNLPVSQATPIYAGYIRSRNPRLTSGQAMEIANGIIGFSLRYGVDARLIMAMVMVESGFNPSATSRVGARGLGQLMPGTARELGVSNAYDTTENLFGTVKLVRNHLDKYAAQVGGSTFEALVLALAAYNAGPGAVRRHGGVPPYRETQNYVQKVVNLYRQFAGA